MELLLMAQNVPPLFWGTFKCIVVAVCAEYNSAVPLFCNPVYYAYCLSARVQCNVPYIYTFHDMKLKHSLQQR